MLDSHSSSLVDATFESGAALDRPLFGGSAGGTRLLTVDDERLEAELVELAADITAGMARWFDLIALYDDRKIWQQWECRSMATWLASHVGVSLITARQYVHVAHAIQRFSILKAEFAAGRLSYSRVRAVVRCVTPETEVAMVAMAKHATAPQLERFAAGIDRVRKRANPGDDEAGWMNRELRLTLDEDGTWILRGRLPAEIGVSLKRALDTEVAAQRLVLLADAAASGDATAGDARLEPIEARRVDALDTLINRGHLATSQRESRPLVVVHQGCRFNGCGRKGRLHSHHVVEYSNGGRTTASNLVMLCDVHHRAVHNHGWIITGDPGGQLTFTRPGLTPQRTVDGDIDD
jgi:hypothetical protein